MPLHIFEQRYKQMMQLCLTEDKVFGVVLIRHGSEALGPLAEPHFIGCTARILDVQTHSEGRMNITTVGEQRFRILSIQNDSPYLVGKVELYPMAYDDPDQLRPAAERLRPQVQQYVHLLKEIEEVDLNPEKFPENPLRLANLAAALLQMPPEKKQELLISTSTLEMLNKTNHVYRRELAFLRAIIDHGKDRDQKHIAQN